jgi:preprotein translocase subunit SecE
MARTTDVKLPPRPAPKPVKAAAPRRMPAVVERVTTYLREVRVELTRVNWPTRRELVSMTIVVVVVLLALSVYLGLFDYIYTVVVKRWLVQPIAR